MLPVTDAVVDPLYAVTAAKEIAVPELSKAKLEGGIVSDPLAGRANTQVGAVVPRVTEPTATFQNDKKTMAAVLLNIDNPNKLPADALTATNAPVALTLILVYAWFALVVAG